MRGSDMLRLFKVRVGGPLPSSSVDPQGGPVGCMSMRLVARTSIRCIKMHPTCYPSCRVEPARTSSQAPDFFGASSTCGSERRIVAAQSAAAPRFAASDCPASRTLLGCASGRAVGSYAFRGGRSTACVVFPLLAGIICTARPVAAQVQPVSSLPEGITIQTKAAIERGLAYLARSQDRQGSWANQGNYGRYPVAMTSLAWTPR